jgi:hypothetical protein
MTCLSTPSFICPRSWLGMAAHRDGSSWTGGPRSASSWREPARPAEPLAPAAPSRTGHGFEQPAGT